MTKILSMTWIFMGWAALMALVPAQAAAVPWPYAGRSFLRDLASLSQHDLDELFRKGRADRYPSGRCPGTTNMVQHERMMGRRAAMIGGRVWQGKVFYPEQQFVLNMVGNSLIARGRLLIDRSYVDRKPVVTIDYADSDLTLFRGVRDEIREVAPGQFLGRAYAADEFWLNFAVECPSQRARR